ncbi:unnamed protein product [Parnassius mnemosyne]|uniref:DUF5641 domain-containing protein n=1 Tax=Parnassius mnemosyne TaxID=213953 RepID=A0AAV1K943_9NEOP
MIRVIAYCRKILQRNKPKCKRNKDYLKTEELKEALEACIRKDQENNFSEEIKAIIIREEIKKNSALKALTPILDEVKILRVGGRLENTRLEHSRKHPIIMAKKSKLTELIIADAHKQTLHGGSQLTINYIRNKYFIIGDKQLVRAHIKKCVICVKNNGHTQNQLMERLPTVRVTPARPFSRSGVDFAGSIQMRSAKGRGHRSYKGYICLFVCMCTKAVHLEAYLAFYSAAPRILYALNSGGLWEAGIKSTKTHLKRVIGTSTLTYEEMATVLAQIEACLNSRPLSRLDADHENIDVLTPGYFLIGEPLVMAPDHNYETSNVSSLRRWQYTQRMSQEFLRKWSREYLNQFFHRYRWSTRIPQPKIGDIVLIKEDGLPPCRWLYGKIVEEHPGQDGISKVVTVMCKNSLIKRPTNKICILPVTQ